MLADAASLPQQKILHDEFAVAAREWSTTSAARYFTVSRFWTGFNFDNLVKRVAIRALEERHVSRLMAPRAARYHKTPRSAWRSVYVAA